jgi:hypothetical protein
MKKSDQPFFNQGRSERDKRQRYGNEAAVDAVGKHQGEKVTGLVEPGSRTVLSNQNHRNQATD